MISPDIELSLIHTPAKVRPALRALWMLDAALGDVVARATEPALGAIKLAWWRERLEELDTGPPPKEPRLEAVAAELLPRGVSGGELAGLEAGWSTLLDREPDAALIASRGSLLFDMGGRLLGTEAGLAQAGALYALALVARRGVPEMFAPARDLLPEVSSTRFPRGVRALTMLTRAAARDVARPEMLEAEGDCARVAAMLGHRWSGRIG